MKAVIYEKYETSDVLQLNDNHRTDEEIRQQFSQVSNQQKKQKI